MTHEEETMLVAFCWYEQSEWETLKQTAADKEILDDTYAEWKSNANKAIAELRADGHQIQKIKVKMEQLEAWCADQGVENKANARTEYAIHEAKLRQSKSTLKA